MKSIQALYLLIAILASATVNLNAQDTTALKNNGQVWLDFFPNFYISGNLQFYGDIGFRALVTDVQWIRIHGRPSVRYHLNNTFVAHGGLGMFLELNKEQGTRFEIRPWQGIQVKWPNFRRLRFSQMLRVEERINHLFQTDETQFELRFRYRLGGTFQFDEMRSAQSLFVPFSIEWFLPITTSVDEVFSNRTRINVGVGLNASPILQFRLITTWQGSRSGRGDEFRQADWVLRLQARYSLDRAIDDDELQ